MNGSSTGTGTSPSSRSSTASATTSSREANGGMHSTKRRRRRRRTPTKNNHTRTLCHSLLLTCLLLMAFLTISLNIMYIHHIHRKSRHHPHGGTSTTSQQHQQQQQEEGTQIHRVDRKGRLLHREIQKVSLQDLGLTDDVVLATTVHNTDTFNNMTRQELLVKGKEPLLQLLHNAGVKDIEEDVLQKLPTWQTIQDLYGYKNDRDGGGSGPILVGADHAACVHYQHTIPQSDASLAVAGMFNTGTNLMALYLEANCKMPHNENRNRGMRWQVPWGKHMFAALKYNHTASHEHKTNKQHVLPVVLVRDPYHWMQSMCRNHYAIRWHHDPQHCPNLVPNEVDYKLFPYAGRNIPVRMDFDGHAIANHASLAHLWSDWYRQYLEADYPRIVVRYEDLMFYPQQLTKELCACAGGVPTRDDGKFTYLVDSAKWGPGHGKQGNKTSLVSAMIKYGNVYKRLKGYTKEDLELAHLGLDEDLMELFRYNRPLEQDLRTTRTTNDT